MGGIKNGTLVGKNADFTQIVGPNAQSSESNGLISNGQLWIGRTAVNAGGTHIDVGTITAGIGISVTNGPGTITISAPGSTTDLHTARFIVGDTSNGANYSTIAAAITAASSGDTIYIQTGTYTENLTLKAGVNLCAFQCDSAVADISAAAASNVTIVGKLSASFNGRCAISGIMLKTNSDFCLVVSGATSTDVNLFGCYINAVNNTALSITTSAGKVNLYYCNGDLGTTGIAYFSQTAGTLEFFYGTYINSGASVTASTCAGATLIVNNISFDNPITVSTSGTITATSLVIQSIGNTTALTTSGTGNSSLKFCIFNSGSASALSIGAGTTVTCILSEIFSSNTNAITGSGTLSYAGVIFSGSSSLVNSTVTLSPKDFGPTINVRGSLNIFPVIDANIISNAFSSANTSIRGHIRATVPGSIAAGFGNAFGLFGQDTSSNDVALFELDAVMDTVTVGAVNTHADFVTYFANSPLISASVYPKYFKQSAGQVVAITTPGGYPYTTLASDYVILVDSSAARSIVPMASPVTGQTYRIKDNVGTAAANNITITPSGKNVDGAASTVINVNYGSVDIVYNGTQWNIL